MADLTGTRVLLVEDEPVIALDHAGTLSDAGAEIIGPFPALGEALRELEHTKVDVAVIDFVLREETSVPLQEELERLHVPFVVVTAYPKVLVRRDGEQEIMAKPVNGDALCEVVKRIRST